MADIALDIRMELFRARPELRVSQADGLVSEVAECFQGVRRDSAAHGQAKWQDFFGFSFIDGVALVSIYRESHLEIFVVAADEALITKAERFAMVDVDKFLEMFRRDYHAPEVGRRFPMSQALPWLETVEKV
jgi:hypothetical protein